MTRKILLAFLLMPFYYCLHAQTKADSAANEFNYYFKPAKWRCIGPFRGGRSVAATGVVGNTHTYYMGTTGGGLWKTEDMGITWNNISDGFFKTGSVGAVSVAENDANVVYVGMGEHAVRGVMTSSGDGVYKSTDAGKTWKKMGLELTQHIARIVIHPKNPDVLLVAAQGALYSKSKERGIYKSTDGGVTWKNVLYVDDKTGCTDLSMDMNNPRILYASMWEHGRKPWQVISGGPGSGLYKSTDGGDHWEKMQEGLPKGMGKMSIAVCRSNSEKVYALIESDFEKEAGGMYVSTDAGKSWSQVSSDHRLVQRAWYYIKVFPDPLNENTLYVMSAQAMRSTDGGKTWEDISSTHGDYHHLWINPANSNNMVIADDGGASITFNQGKSWSSQNNMPTAQFYRINTDNQFPYNIYGGQQDNSSVKIASRELGGSGIGTSSWTYSAGGESAFLAFNPDDPQYVLGGSYAGTIEVLDSKAKGSTNIMEAPIQYQARDAKDMKYRCTWNAPIIWSKHEPNVFYHGAQYLLRTADTGRTWTEASPDLTRNEKEKQGKAGVPFTNEGVGAEIYGTLSYVFESPYEKGVIYTGSDDGLVHLTKDNGAHWQNITPAGLPECLINAIEVSPFDKATVYIATTRYKFNDHTPGLYKSTDYGKTWVKINNGIPVGAFTRVVREDEKRKDLLFAGTETGVYISWNGGKEWMPFQLNLPVAPITDLHIHQGNLIASTSGRSFWVLDDLSLIRQYKKDGAFSIFEPTPAYLVNGYSELDETDATFTGLHKSRGVNPSTGVVLYYQLPEIKDSAAVLTMEIKDAEGNVVRSFSSKADSTYKKYNGGPPEEPALTKTKGLNRFVWNMRYATIPGVPEIDFENSYRGHKASPGKYTIILKMGAQNISTTAEILANPLYARTAADYKLYHTTMNGMEKELTTMHQMVNNMEAKREQLESLAAHLPGDEKYNVLRTAVQTLAKKMKAWDDDMVQRKSKAYDDAENFPNKFTANYMFLLNMTESDIPRVNQPSLDLLKDLNAQWAVLKNRATEILDNNVPALNKLLWEAGVGAVWKR
jgi:photosystem II stability/assembly factor-like uncharacterized protein